MIQNRQIQAETHNKKSVYELVCLSTQTSSKYIENFYVKKFMAIGRDIKKEK